MIPHSKPWINDQDRRVVEDVMLSGMVAKGTKAKLFEQRVNVMLGGLNAVSVGSGTAALTFALKTLGVDHAAEVILPTYVCHQVLDAVINLGATPVLCDTGTHWNMTVDTVQPHISSKTRAIILVHIFGIVLDVHSFAAFGIPLIEDCCQALGGTYQDQLAGSVGDFGVFSFHATKCMTTGEGGIVITRQTEYGRILGELDTRSAMPSPLTDMQAALGLSQLDRYDQFLERRRQIADRYFHELPTDTTQKLIQTRPNSMFFRFVVAFDKQYDFDAAWYFFAQHGVTVRLGVDELLHRRLGLPDITFPNATGLFNTTLSLPIYPALLDNEQTHVIETFHEFWQTL